MFRTRGIINRQAFRTFEEEHSFRTAGNKISRLTNSLQFIAFFYTYHFV